ncbi:SMCHD1 [Mytilus edulis]|uniref:SMCHD1 n=1 Tax=Mytilus edulis TaxID=6550 RepID=A0A8S3TK40_MYTED|nr:SMCHD1 [Mytilus edulis]
MAALSKHRDELQTVIRTYKSLFETTEQLIKELKSSVHEAQLEENRIKEDLTTENTPCTVTKCEFYIVHSSEIVDSVDRLISERTRQRENIMTAPRRICSWLQLHKNHNSTRTTSSRKGENIKIHMVTAPQEPQVLGKIGHLALVADTDIARGDVVAHVFRYGLCVVTFTTDKVSKVLPLSHHTDKEMVTELSNGKFGGLMNKALPIEKLRGAVFGEPLPNTFDESSTLISTVQSYKAALLRTQRAQEELQEQVDHYKDAEMQSKHKECRKLNNSSKMCYNAEYKIYSPSRPNIQTKTISDAPSPNKRARTSAVTPTPPTRSGTTPTPPTRSSGTTLTPPARIPTPLTRGSGNTTAPSTRGTGTTLTPPARTQTPSTRGSGTIPSPSTRSSGGTSQPSTRASGSTTNVPEDVIVISSASASSVPSTPTRQSKRISSQTPTSNKRLRKT